MTEHDWREEQQRVDRVMEEIGQRIQTLEGEVGKVRLEVVDIRKHFWDEVTVNLGSADDIVETQMSIRQQSALLSERERRYSHTAAVVKGCRRLIQSPYFGRIDFTEQGNQQPQAIYIGVVSFIDADNEFLVYDWRAPVSSLYYDYGPGPASYQAPFEDISGRISLKRQYTIRDGRIALMFDTGVTIGDELLMRVLGRHADEQMKSIVATIQKEQNQIIRNDNKRLLIVQGAAGSGKTSAALQRVAYLLYKHRKTLRADQMVLFSPNPMFNSYVSTVLPELGEENMVQTTFQEYLEHRLDEDFKVEDTFSQMEYVLMASESPDYPARRSGISYKSSVDYLNAVRAYRDKLERERMVFQPVMFDGRMIVSAAYLQRQFYAYGASVRLHDRIEQMCEWLQKQVSAFEEAQLSEPWIEAEIELLEPEDYQRAYKRLRHKQRGRGETFDDFEQEKALLARVVVKRRLKPVYKWIRELKFVDVSAIYRQLFTDQKLFAQVSGGSAVPKDWPEVCQQTIRKLDAAELFNEDATPYLYLKELLQGTHVNTTIRYVIVDEAQDYSPLQLAVIKRLFPRSKMTALGDSNQAIYVHGSVFETPDILASLYGPDQTETIRLHKSYRSTREIVEFTRGMVRGGAEIEAFLRPGAKPQVAFALSRQQLHQQITTDATSLTANGYASIAIVCKTAGESAEAFEALSKGMAMRLITKYTPTFERGTVVIPAYLAKGVEFDAVIIYDASRQQYRQPHERKLFYTACTRAMHTLHLYSLGELSPFVTAQAANLYSVIPEMHAGMGV